MLVIIYFLPDKGKSGQYKSVEVGYLTPLQREGANFLGVQGRSGLGKEFREEMVRAHLIVENCDRT